MCFWKTLSEPSLSSVTYKDKVMFDSMSEEKDASTYDVFMALRLEPLAQTEL